MSTLPIQMQTIYRPEGEDSDDVVGRDITALVRNALARGAAPGSTLVLRAGRLDIIPMGPLVQKKVHIGAFLAGLSRSVLTEAGGAMAVGVMGVFGGAMLRIKSRFQSSWCSLNGPMVGGGIGGLLSMKVIKRFAKIRLRCTVQKMDLQNPEVWEDGGV